MSYLVLARKYRPRTFSEMVGQEHVVQALANALGTQRLHHAYMFTGTRGVGKTTVSRILAKSLNCQGPDGNGGITATPCGVCQACLDIDSGRFVDYVELDAASNRGVEEVQGLLEQAVYKPVQGRFKVFMIDEVHMLTNTAFNAMLKTLEEPPEYLKFVLATTDPQKVPVTVLSRCLQFNLRPMAPETVLEHLTRVLANETVPAEPASLRLLARAARGSMRDALSLTDQAIAYCNGELTETGVRQMLGSVDRGHVFRLLDALAQGDGRTVVEISEGLRRDGLSAGSTLEEMISVLQAMAVLQAVPERAGLQDSDDPDALETARLAEAMAPEDTQLLYSLCIHGRGELGLAPDEYAAMTMVLLRPLAFRSASQAQRLAEKKTLNSPVAPSAPAAAPVAMPPQARGQMAPNVVAPPESPPPVVEPPASPVDHGVPGREPERSVESAARTMRPAETSARSAETSLAEREFAPPEDDGVVLMQDEVPPWEDQALPPGQQLPVVERPDPRSAPRSPGGPAARPAQHPVHAVPLRVQGAAGARDLPRPSGDEQPPTQVVPTEEGDFWFATVTRLVAEERITALARELALQSQLVGRDDDQWLLRVERESLGQAGSRDKLHAALAAIGHSVKIAIEVGAVSDSPARRNKAAAEARQRAAEDAIRNDPLVQRMMREFDARIVPGSLRPL
ncbi:DNA polymerase III subunit gamma/tau [Variovorax dokdonensis]|uniref:DNA polymerase III subunit gamma/tau n=1 Tax=Variovorax dokdonensis TaxID=344883 RepID=A0ABT7NCL5_9BURK|nr:DNA polymerase III subunit gamma/tau [Variovorax dokdonensis]MDM0045673.1 DNA polymerase III subunit gamma/tau [Variovorax dokdonensis]